MRCWTSVETVTGQSQDNPSPIRLLELRPAGMFSNVNEVVQQLYLAEMHGYRFTIDWSASSYRDGERTEDPWNYYFEDCYPGPLVPTDPDPLPGGIEVACTRDNIITPRAEDNRCDPLLLPRDRDLPHRIITEYLHPKPHIEALVAAFAEAHFEQPTIGLHVRGPGRNHGGVPEMRSRLGHPDRVPLAAFVEPALEAMRQLGSSRLFLASDSAMVIREIRQSFGDEVVVTYSAIRSEFGEMHQRGQPQNRGLQFDTHKLGEDVLVEAYLLSQTDYLVHGNSNVANFVICANPELRHHYVEA